VNDAAVSPVGLAHSTFAVTAADGVSQRASEWSSAQNAPVVVLLPGLGVAAGYYEPFARMLAQWRPLIVAGHSLGGQLATLYAGCMPASVAGLGILAAGSTHVALWKGSRRIAASAYTSVVRMLGAVWPWYPGRLIAFGGDHPRRLIRDWGHVGATGRYEPEGATFDYEAACRRATMPVLSVGIRGDPPVPPWTSGCAVYSPMQRARSASREVEARPSAAISGLAPRKSSR
jgi:predicted alpha/beta hydrolase